MLHEVNTSAAVTVAKAAPDAAQTHTRSAALACWRTRTAPADFTTLALFFFITGYSETRINETHFVFWLRNITT
jgi:hypothetical protein